MDTETTYHFDPLDLEQVRLLADLPAERRVRTMLEARELAVGLIRGRLREKMQHSSLKELNLSLLEELERGEKQPS